MADEAVAVRAQAARGPVRDGTALGAAMAETGVASLRRGGHRAGGQRFVRGLALAVTRAGALFEAAGQRAAGLAAEHGPDRISLLRARGRVDDELQRFFDAGRPIVFTLGSSAVGAAGSFWRESLRAVERLGLRALFLTGSHAHGLPERLPARTLARAYAPHALVFPQAAAIVHQGGIGTTAQAMCAGRPMLVVPFAHDQFDNGERMKRLGMGEVLPRSRYSAERAERQLGRLLGERAWASAAVEVCAGRASGEGRSGRGGRSREAMSGRERVAAIPLLSLMAFLMLAPRRGGLSRSMKWRTSAPA